MGNECKKSICECGICKCDCCAHFKNDNFELKFTLSTKSGRNQNLTNSKINNQNINDDENQGVWDK